MVISSIGATELQGEPGYGVLPRPDKSIPGEGSFAVTAEASLLLCPGTGPGDRFACKEFNDWIAELGFRRLTVKELPDGEQPPAGAILLGPPLPGNSVSRTLEFLGTSVDNLEIPAEGYVLAVGEHAAVAAGPTEAGRFYALMTLAQLFRRSGGLVSLPAVLISDSPKLSLRGISDDISRGQVSTLEDLKTIVRFLARYKMNVYMPYLEDMFTFRSHPDFGAGRGALTGEETAELIDFARRRHLRIIPIFQTLGHYENLLLQPGYRHLAEFPGAACLSPAEDQTYSFLGDVLAEIVPAFQDEYFNIACDESWDIGRGKSRQLTRRIGIAKVHARHYRKVYEMVTALGRRVMIYGDIILKNPSILEELPDDMVVVDWHYNAARNYPSVSRFRSAGLDVVVSPGVSNWNRFYPDYDRALTNIEHLTRTGYEQGALGAVTSSWCDNGGANLRQLNFWGYAFAASCAWNPLKVDRRTIELDFWRSFLAVDDPGPWLKVNRLLSSLGRGFTIYDWWRHPLLKPSAGGGTGKSRDAGKRSAALKSEMEQANALIGELRPGVRANHWFVDLLSFTAEIGECLAEKYLWQDEFRRAGTGALAGEQGKPLAEKAGKLRSSYARIGERFSWFWNLYNRPQGLEHNLALFDLQLARWETITEALRAGKQPPEATIDKHWIAAPGSRNKKKKNKVRSACFRAGIDCGETPPVKALVQVMGTSHVEAYLNGDPVDETIGRRTLSLIVERSRARVLDLTGKFRPGTNVLAVRVTNYEGRIPGANLWCELQPGGPGGTLTFFSDDNWRGIETDSEPAGWAEPSFDDRSWGRCEIFSPGLPVSAPMLEKGFKSRIER